ncbi:MAG TPA: alpha/beta hydrolase-fold protein [Acidimicrobiia bacterium]
MRSCLIAVAVLATACSAGLDVPTEQHLQAVYTHSDGTEMRYLVWLPDGYGDDRDRRYPMILFLHGSGDEDYDAAWVISVGLPAVLAQDEEPDDFEFVVVSPQAAPGTIWYAREQPEIVDGVLQEVLDTYLVDPDRVYLTGLSMGGYGSWHIATRYPERYAALASVSGSGYQQLTLPPPEFACRLAAVPVWGWHGQHDLIARYEPVHEQVVAWEHLCDTPVRWTGLSDDGHLSTYEKAYRDPELYEWFLENTLSGSDGR